MADLRAPTAGRSAAHNDEELGHGVLRDPEKMQDLSDSSNAKLQEFRMLVGIIPDPSFSKRQSNGQNRAAINQGLYPIVVNYENKNRTGYVVCSILVGICLAIQIFLAVAVTALGAAQASHAAVTVLGAINTVAAGILTYIKGTGLPNRLKYIELEWSKIRIYIEQLERDLRFSENTVVNLSDEINTLRDMYEETIHNIEANRPDRFGGNGSVWGRRPGKMSKPAVEEPHFGHRRISRRQSPEEKRGLSHHVESVAHEPETRVGGEAEKALHHPDSSGPGHAGVASGADVARSASHAEHGTQEQPVVRLQPTSDIF